MRKIAKTYIMDKETDEHLKFLAEKFRISQSSVVRFLVVQAYEQNKTEAQQKI
jgi:hypothetical protein